jgi:hypothetical protein
MTKEMRDDLTPQGYIRQMFRETKDGQLDINYYHYIEEPETITYQVNWTAEDANLIVQKYNLLTSALARSLASDDSTISWALRKAERNY